MRTPPLLADFTHTRVCKPFCEKSLTLPSAHLSRLSYRYRSADCTAADNPGYTHGQPPSQFLGVEMAAFLCREIWLLLQSYVLVTRLYIPFAPSGGTRKSCASLRISSHRLHTDRQISLMLHSAFAYSIRQNPPVLLSLESVCAATNAAPFQRQREQKV